MLHDILIPLDGSALAERALSLAAGLGRLTRSRLHLMRVGEPVSVFAELGEPVRLPASGSASGSVSERYLERTADTLRHSSRCLVATHEATGWAGPEICEAASRLNCQLIVMTTHGQGGSRRAWFGNVADFTVRHSGVPVLLVPPHARRLDAAFHHILVALDLSRPAEAIVAPAAALARMTGALLTLLHVLEAPAPSDAPLLAVARRDAERRLGDVADRVAGEGLRVRTLVLAERTAVEGLLQELEQRGNDLLALTTHGAGGPRRLMLGSCAAGVLRRATKPVLVLRPPHGVSPE